MSSKPSFTISERILFLRIFDILSVVLGILFAASFEDFYYFDISSSKLLTWFATLIVYLVLFAQIFEMYNLKNSNDYFTIIRSILLTSFTTTIFYIFTPIISPELPLNRMQILYLFAATTIPLVIWRIIYIVFIFAPKYFRTTLLIGDVEEVRKLRIFIETKASTNQVVGCVSTEQCKDDMQYYNLKSANIIDIVKDLSISEIVVAEYDPKTYKNVHSQLVQLFEYGTAIISSKRFKEREAFLMPEMKLEDAFYDVITFSRSHQSKIYLLFNKLVDIIISIIGILFMALLLPFLWVGNAIGNKGSLFYYQNRVGKNGEVFEIIKLRTMIQDAEKNGAEWAKKNDSRITRFGKFLRKTRLDEVPQFINIIRGDMALIGPRPERPEFVTNLEKELPFYAIRHLIKPGLTGWAQVKHPYASSLEDQGIKMRYDLYYIKERSFLLDFKILVKTITTVLFFRGQ